MFCYGRRIVDSNAIEPYIQLSGNMRQNSVYSSDHYWDAVMSLVVSHGIFYFDARRKG
jgi:hypothetical protein